MSMLSAPNITDSMMRVQTYQQQATDKGLVSDADKSKMMEKAKEFESFFVYQMMELMKSEVETEFDGGQGESMFRHTLHEHIADSITEAGGFGIATTVYNQLLKQQEQRAASLAKAAATYAATAN